MVVVGAFGAFGFGWATGANDVANAFGTSVGSGALTNLQAVMIAAVFEFVGAMVLGRVSTSTIAGSIADRTVFYYKAKKHPECSYPGNVCQAPVYGYGMMWTLWVGFLWQGFATYHGLNVSATHSIIGGIIGFALAYSKDGVLWITEDPLSIPPYKGVVPIVIAWFFAPITTAFASGTMFYIIRTFVLRHEDSYERAFKVLPILILITTWINIYFVFTKGAKKTLTKNNGNDWSDDKAAWIAFVIAAGLAIISIAGIPLIRSRAEVLESRAIEKDNAAKIDVGLPDIGVEEGVQVVQSVDGEKQVAIMKNEDGEKQVKATPSDTMKTSDSVSSKAMSQLKLISDSFVLKGKDGKDFMEDLSDPVLEMHSRAEHFDRKTESVFGVLQVFSACCVMFAHGAGEVGYMAGPLATIVEINKSESLPKSVEAPIWVIFLSAISLVIGLATYGQRITRAMGKEMAVITPARGFSAELATAVVIMVAAQYGLPTSSSQCITGGILGIGLVEGVNGVNWALFSKTFSSWVMTLFVMGICTAALFAQGHAAP